MGNTYTSHIPYVQHIQNHAMRKITKSLFYFNAAVLSPNNVSSVRTLFQYRIVILLFKLFTDQLPLHFIELCCLTNPNSTKFAANYNYLLTLVSTNYENQTPHFFAIPNWNILPDGVKSLLFYQQLKAISKSFFCSFGSFIGAV